MGVGWGGPGPGTRVTNRSWVPGAREVVVSVTQTRWWPGAQQQGQEEWGGSAPSSPNTICQGPEPSYPVPCLLICEMGTGKD